MNARLFVPLCASILLDALLGAGLKLNPREVTSPLIGKAAPAVWTRDLLPIVQRLQA